MKSQLDVGEGKGRQKREGEQRESRDRAEGEMGEAGSRRQWASEHVGFLGMMSAPLGCHRFSWMNEKQKESEEEELQEDHQVEKRRAEKGRTQRWEGDREKRLLGERVTGDRSRSDTSLSLGLPLCWESPSSPTCFL